MKDTGYEDVVLDSIEQIVAMIQKTGKRIVDSIVESDPVGKMEKWLNEEIPDAIRVIEANGGWAKFFSLMWHVQEKCGDELKMADVVKWVQGNLPKMAVKAVMLVLPADLVPADRSAYKLHYYVGYLNATGETEGDSVLYCHCNRIDDGLYHAFGDKGMIVFN